MELRSTIAGLYYKYSYRNRILYSRPFTCGARNEGFEIHVLTSRHDLLDSLWCLKTFLHYSGTRPRVVIHGDSTLGETEARLIRGQLTNAEVVRKTEADETLKQYLAEFRSCYEYRHRQRNVFALKLFEPQCYARDNVLLLDSDVLFFRRPKKMLDLIQNGTGFFLSDYKNSYSFGQYLMEERFGTVLEKVNAGVAYVPKILFDLALIEDVLTLAREHQFPRMKWIEQTAQAVLFSSQPGRVERLDDLHQISRQAISADTVCHHFVNDGSRTGFYSRGLRRLVAQDFLGSALGQGE